MPLNPAGKVRIVKFIASLGLCSRRKAINFIQNHEVSVNQKRVTDPSLALDPKKDKVRLKGRLLKPPQKKIYIAFHKPEKVLTTMEDPKNRPCVADFFKKSKFKIFPVGRLDWHSSGLMLLTNDGDLAFKVLHPRHSIPKTYLVKLNRPLTGRQVLKLKKGVFTPLGRLKALYIKKTLSPQGGKKTSNWWKIIISEGKNRQLHRMFEQTGSSIKVLRRVGIGRLKLGRLKAGGALLLSPGDVQKVFIPPKELA